MWGGQPVLEVDRSAGAVDDHGVPAPGQPHERVGRHPLVRDLGECRRRRPDLEVDESATEVRGVVDRLAEEPQGDAGSLDRDVPDECRREHGDQGVVRSDGEGAAERAEVERRLGGEDLAAPEDE